MMQLLLKLVVVALLVVSILGGSADYSHIALWPGECNTGHSQSPINIITSEVNVCGESRFHMKMWNGTTTVSPFLGHHSSLKSDYPSSIMTIVDSRGKLLQYISAQYHLHAPSEHTINGYHADLQLHIVHTLNDDLFVDSMTLAVLGVMFKLVNESSTEPTLFDKLDFTATTLPINLNTTLGPYLQNENVFHYRGSLTTPECDEIVNWFVLQKALPIRPSSLEAIKKQLNDDQANSRPIQDLNHREVFYITPSCNTNFSFEVNKKMALYGWRVVACLALFLLFL